MNQSRDLIFISHANPEDNEFTRWLALRLAREGYKIWSDLTNLLGGEIFWNDIDEAIRKHSVKFLFVLTKHSNKKEGTLNELSVANTIGKEISDPDFIIPLGIDESSYGDTYIQIHRRNVIPFTNWGNGFNQLIKKLEKDNVPKNLIKGEETVTNWWRSHFSAEEGLRSEQEEHLSSWFPFGELPSSICIHQLPKNYELPELQFSASRHKDYLFSFATKEQLGIDSKISVLTRIYSLDEFLKGNFTKPIEIQKYLASRLLNTILNDSWLRFVKTKDFPTYQYSDGARALYYPHNFVPNNKIKFIGVDGKTYRQVCGESDKQGLFWHFGIRAKAKQYPFRCFEIKPHVLFSDDGTVIWDKPNALHRKRRSYCKNWWNDEWRDRILAVMSYLSNERNEILIPLSGLVNIIVSSNPILFNSPVSYDDPKERIKLPAEVEDDEEDEVIAE